MVNFTRMHKIVILIIAVVITLGIGFKILAKDSPKGIQIEDNGLFSDDGDGDIFKNSNNSETDGEVDTPEEVVVHITGEVSKPGLVTLKNGSRVADAIKEAGGLKPSADETNINLAQKLFDEDKIVIPKVGENLITDNSEASDRDPFGSSEQTIVSSRNDKESSGGSSGGGQININTASKEQLKTLPGIGEVTSQKIIDYRESTKFGSIDDIKNVSGIGDKKFEAIRSMITTR